MRSPRPARRTVRVRSTNNAPDRVTRPALRLLTEDVAGCLAHLHLADLAGDGHGELVDEVDVSGDLVVGELAGAELAQRLGGEWCRPRAQVHPGHELLAVL